MKAMSMFPLLAVLSAGLGVCAADAVIAARHPVRLPQPGDCRVVAARHQVIVIVEDGVVVGVADLAKPMDCREGKLRIS